MLSTEVILRTGVAAAGPATAILPRPVIGGALHNGGHPLLLPFAPKG
jgi:hypothetical protein